MLLRSRLSSLVLGPWAVLQQRLTALGVRRPPPALMLADMPCQPCQPAAAPPAASSASSLAELLLDGLLRMAVPKKKVSYTRKRKRIAGFQAIRGPKLQTHMYMCPTCERMRGPHRVCGYRCSDPKLDHSSLLRLKKTSVRLSAAAAAARTASPIFAASGSDRAMCCDPHASALCTKLSP
jgi:ribosomal protein L32